jgi:hypothetical protein
MLRLDGATSRVPTLVETRARVTSARQCALQELDDGRKKQLKTVYSGGRGPPCSVLVTERKVRWRKQGSARLSTQHVGCGLARLKLGGGSAPALASVFHLMLASSPIPRNIATRLIRARCAQHRSSGQRRVPGRYPTLSTRSRE